MKTKFKITAAAVAGMLVGYALGTVVAWPSAGGDLGSGDISKVSKFHKSATGSQTSALEEKLRSDTLAFNRESSMVALINSRMTDFADLVDCAIMAASGKDEFNEEVESLINVRELSDNAVQAGKIAAASLEYLESGEKNELVTDYEQASQNLVVAYMMVDRQVRIGKQFVSAADEYLGGKSPDGVPEIALVRDLWAEYCAESALLNGDRQEMAYWGKKNMLANSDIIEKGIKTLGILEGAQEVIRDKTQDRLDFFILGMKLRHLSSTEPDAMLRSIQEGSLNSYRLGALATLPLLSYRIAGDKYSEGSIAFLQQEMQNFICDRCTKSLISVSDKNENTIGKMSIKK